jgi:choline dehydrogenase-like flavoprotein
VVIGGGSGGATAARYLARDGRGRLDVTLIEPTRTYYTCYFSNLYHWRVLGSEPIWAIHLWHVWPRATGST